MQLPLDLKAGDKLWYSTYEYVAGDKLYNSKYEYVTVANRASSLTPYTYYDSAAIRVKAVDANGKRYLYSVATGVEVDEDTPPIAFVERVTSKENKIPSDLKADDKLWYSDTEFVTVRDARDVLNTGEAPTPYIHTNKQVRIVAIGANGKTYVYDIRSGVEVDGDTPPVIRVERITSAKPQDVKKPLMFFHDDAQDDLEAVMRSPEYIGVGMSASTVEQRAGVIVEAIMSGKIRGICVSAGVTDLERKIDKLKARTAELIELANKMQQEAEGDSHV